MSINWPMLGIWLGAAVGVFVAYLVLLKIAGQRLMGTLIDALVIAVVMWTLSTGIVRSVTTWSVTLCWLAGLPLSCALYVGQIFLFDILPDWWKERRGKAD